MELRLILLEALNAAPYAGSAYRIVLTLFSLAFLLTVIWPSLRANSNSNSQGDRRGWFYAASVALIVWARLPGLLAPLLNPDEGIFTAAAVRLLQDPIYWRSADAFSSGPLNIFPLTLPAVAGLTLDFASSRLVGLIMIAASTCLLHAALCGVVRDAIARLAVMPVVATVALLQLNDFVHYSGEHGPVLLLSVGLYLLCRLGAEADLGRPNAATVFGVGFWSGLMPYTKMQGVPVAFVLCLIAIHILWVRCGRRVSLMVRPSGWLVAGAVLPSLVLVAYLWAFSLWTLFWNSYLQTSLFFYGGLKTHGLMAQTRNFARLFFFTPNIGWLIFTTGVFAICGAVLFVARSRAGLLQSMRTCRPPYVAYALAMFGAAVFAVARPGNPFQHYLLFLIMPMGFFIGTVLAEFDRVLRGHVDRATAAPRLSRRALTTLLFASAILPLGIRVATGGDYLSRHASYLQSYRGPIADAIRQVAAPGESMVVWGMSPNLFIESGLVQSIRYGFTVWQIEDNPLRQNFIDEFVRECERAQASIFVDALAPGMFYIHPVDVGRQAHDAFPAVAHLVRRDYEMVREIQGVRIYRRRAGN